MKTIQKIIKTILLLTVYCSINSVFAQAPQKMNYQAVVRNANNELVANTIIGMKISILKTSATGTAVYEETQNPTTNNNGLAVIEIGNGTVVSGSFSGIDWANDLYFVKTETDPFGGTNYTISGTSQLTSVPYALNAKTSEDNKWSSNANGINNISGNVGIGTTQPDYKLDVVHSGSNGVRIKSTSGYSVLDIDSQSGESAIRFAENGVNKWIIDSGTDDNSFNINELGANGGSRISIKEGTGNVGIGNSDPSYNLDISKRMRLRSESALLGAGIWFNKNDNSSENVFLGNDVSNNLQVYSLAGNRTIANFNPTTGGFRVEGPAVASPTANALSIGGYGKVEVDAPGFSGKRFNIQQNGNIGVGTTTPNAPLQFGNTIANRKIVLWENANNDNQFYGLGINGGTLRYQVPEAADHAFFTGFSTTESVELLRLKGNGAIVIGNDGFDPNQGMGSKGQVLTSGGPDGQVRWRKPLNVDASSWSNNSNSNTIIGIDNQTIQTRFVTIPAGENALMLISAKIQLLPTGCSGLGCLPEAVVSFSIDGNIVETTYFNMDNNNSTQEYVISNFGKNVGPGNHNYSISVRKRFSTTNDFVTNTRNNTLIIIPQ